MKTLKIVPNGWPCTLGNCPPGLFVYEDQLYVKSIYLQDGGPNVEAYSAEGGVELVELIDDEGKGINLENFQVMPCTAVWEDA